MTVSNQQRKDAPAESILGGNGEFIFRTGLIIPVCPR